MDSKQRQSHLPNGQIIPLGSLCLFLQRRFYVLPEKSRVDILPELLQKEPVPDVAAAEHPVHRPVLPRPLVDLDLEGEGAQLGQGDGRDPVEYVDRGEDEEEHVPEVEDEEDLEEVLFFDIRNFVVHII